MTQRYTVERRAEILDNLQTFLQTDEQIVGLVLVGSGAQDFRDVYSDINLLVIVDNAAAVTGLFQKWKTRLAALYPRLAGFEAADALLEQYHYTCLLDNFLTLDLYFVKQRRVSAYKRPWRILFDRTQQLNDQLVKTTAEALAGAPQRHYTQMIETMWLPILKAVAALRRDQIWQAMYLLETLRKQAVELAGLNHGVDTHEFTGVDQLPEMFLIHLRHTVPTSTSALAVRRALRTTVVLLFGEIARLEDRMNLPRAATLRQRILSYIEIYS